MLKKRKVFCKGHYVLKGGEHSAIFVNAEALESALTAVPLLCEAFVEHITWTERPQVIVGPADGGALFAECFAHHLGNRAGIKIPYLVAKKDGKGGFDLSEHASIHASILAGKTVFVIDDVTTTGGALSATVDEVRTYGGVVCGAGAIINRGNVTQNDIAGAPDFFSLIQIEITKYSGEECPLCANHVPMNTDLGHGEKWLGNKPDYPRQ